MKHVRTTKTVLISAAIVACLGIIGVRNTSAEDIITQPIRTFGLGTLLDATYSPDGRYIATCGGGGAFLWNVETGNCIRTFTRHAGRVSSVAFSPDGTRVLTGSWDGTAKLWPVGE